MRLFLVLNGILHTRPVTMIFCVVDRNALQLFSLDLNLKFPELFRNHIPNDHKTIEFLTAQKSLDSFQTKNDATLTSRRQKHKSQNAPKEFISVKYRRFGGCFPPSLRLPVSATLTFYYTRLSLSLLNNGFQQNKQLNNSFYWHLEFGHKQVSPEN